MLFASQLLFYTVVLSLVLSSLGYAGQGASLVVMQKNQTVDEQPENPQDDDIVDFRKNPKVVVEWAAKICAENRCATVQELEEIATLLPAVYVDERDSNLGSTALMFAVQRGDLPFIRLLLKYGANPLEKSHTGAHKNSLGFALDHREVMGALGAHLLNHPNCK